MEASGIKNTKCLPIIIAHRGANTFAPENSLAAFEQAIRLGCDGIEMDLRQAAGGEVVVFHDKRLYRMTGRWGNISQLTVEQLRAFRLHESPDYRIPTLKEALDLLGDRLILNLDIKSDRSDNDQFVEQILLALNEFRLRENIVLSSFNPDVISSINRLGPGFGCGLIFRKRPPQATNGTLISIGSMHAYHRLLSRKYISALQAQQHRVYAWTVDKARHMKRVVNLGVDGIITNRPEIFFEQVKNIQTIHSR